MTDDTTSRSDWLLGDFVAAADKNGSSVGVSLCLDGILITGVLIGVKQYFEALGDALSAAVRDRDPVAAKATKDSYYQIGSDIIGRQNGSAVARSLVASEPRPPEFFHMLQARVVAGVGIIPTQAGMVFRGRLSAVTGFAIGTLAGGR